MTIIQHAVWLYHRFPLSYRDVQELLHQRGIQVSHETLREWCIKFGPLFAEEGLNLAKDEILANPVM